MKQSDIMTIAVDFDGTIVTHEFPAIGQLLPGVKKTIAALRKNDHKVFLWTMRGYHPEHRRCLEEAAWWLEDNDIVLDGFNHSPSRFSTQSPKQHANIYIDDAALGCPLCIYGDSVAVDWLEVAKYLCRERYINQEQLTEIQDDIHHTYTKQGLTYHPCSYKTS